MCAPDLFLRTAPLRQPDISGRQNEQSLQTPHRRPSSRRGVLVVEMVVCCVMLAMVSLILVPALRAVSQQRQAIRFSTLSAIELNNLHQRLQQTGQVDEDKTELPLSPWFRRRYPDAVLSISRLPAAIQPDGAVEANENQAADRLLSLRLTISRPTGSNRPDALCTVVVWVSQPIVAENTPQDQEPQS